MHIRPYPTSCLFILILALAGCGGQAANQPNDANVPVLTGKGGQSMAPLYHQMGLMASETPMSFVAKVAYFATTSPDTTLALASISIPNRTLNFVRDGDQYRAPYEVRLVLRRDGAEVQNIVSTQTVMVGSFREVGRTDESVIFQHYFRLLPGQYSLSLQIRDATSARGAAQEGLIVVPALRSGQLSTPVIVHEGKLRTRLDSVPNILPSPRSSATFGQEATISVYVEGYGPGMVFPIRMLVRDNRGTVIWSDTATLRKSGGVFSGLLDVPVSRVGVGISTIMLVPRASTDTVSAKVFLGFGPDIPLLSFDDLLVQLRFFATSERIRSLRDTPLDQRGRAWGSFLQTTDPVPSTPEHEGLQAYFSRIQVANLRFRSGGETGWTSDRGAVFVTLGEPDQIFEQQVNQTNRGMMSPTGRVQLWQYSQFNTRLAFYDPTSSGRWELTPASRAEFSSLTARQLVR